MSLNVSLALQHGCTKKRHGGIRKRFGTITIAGLRMRRHQGITREAHRLLCFGSMPFDQIGQRFAFSVVLLIYGKHDPAENKQRMHIQNGPLTLVRSRFKQFSEPLIYFFNASLLCILILWIYFTEGDLY